ncbi:hypothetical protein CTI12_AA567710 [Artemisia annua]|uniref:Zinc knuckle CX2CX4HX4C n=1 Tax=Artemisia annua TaxID=35608 RepID=A0A2U1KTG1_ARTAN|nr:hypothetical protein CTI12_AA567710 [Artemisia annua]
MLMDRLTKERCLKKAGKLDFARVLVEVSAIEDSLNYIEIEYPQIGDSLLEWPPLCTHCKTFGHATGSCKIRPRTEEEIAAKVIKDALKTNVNESGLINKGKAVDDGFTMVGRNNKPIVNQSNVKQNDMRNKNSGSSNKQFVYKQGPNQQVRGGYPKSQVMGAKSKGGNTTIYSKNGQGSKYNADKSTKAVVSKNSGLVQKPTLSTKFNENFKPKVLVRCSSSKANVLGSNDENSPVANSFQAFKDHDMIDKEEAFNDAAKDEYDKTVWPMLKSVVDNVMKSGVYPSMKVRTEWSLSQLDYFYKNCANYGMEPYVEDDDVELENEGMADVMKPEKLDVNGPDVGSDRTTVTNVNNEC